MELDGHQDRRLAAIGAGAVALAAGGIRDAILVLTKRNFARAEIDARTVHRLHPPGAGKWHNPLRRGVFVPFADPSRRLDREDDRGVGTWLLVVPLRIGVADTLELEILQNAFRLVTNAVFVGPEMPVMDERSNGSLLSGLRAGGDRGGA